MFAFQIQLQYGCFLTGIPQSCEDVSNGVISSQKGTNTIEIDPDGVGGVDSFNVTCTLNGKYNVC